MSHKFEPNHVEKNEDHEELLATSANDQDQSVHSFSTFRDCSFLSGSQVEDSVFVEGESPVASEELSSIRSDLEEARLRLDELQQLGNITDVATLLQSMETALTI